MIELDKELIESAKITAFNPRNVDRLIAEYERSRNEISESDIKDKNEWLEELHQTYNDHLAVLGNYVSGWTAGRESHQTNATTSVDKSNGELISFGERLREKLEEVDYLKNKERHDRVNHRMKVARLMRDIGAYQDGNKRLFYEKLVALYELDKHYFAVVYRELEGKIAKNSTVNKLYKELI